MVQGHADHFASLRAPPGLAKGGGAEYEDHINNNVSLLKKFRTDELANTEASSNVLDNLDPTLDTLPYIFILCARVQIISKTSSFPDEVRRGAILWSAITYFLARADPVEMRYAGAEWLYLYEIVETSAQHESMTGKNILVVPHLVTAILRLDPSSGVLTHKHLNLVRYGIFESCSSQLLPILRQRISHIPKKVPPNHEGYSLASSDCPPRVYLYRMPGVIAKPLTLQDLQEYLIAAAINLIAVHDWRMAAFYLENVLVTPCGQGANGYMLEAYKKWILVSLLAYGRVKDLPNGLSGSTRRTIKVLAKPYETIAEVFGRSNHLRILAEIQEGNSFWNEDANVGLMQQVLCEHQRRVVTKLSNIYAALPITTVATRVKMTEQATAHYLKTLIQQNKLAAQIDSHRDGCLILRFLEGAAEGRGSKSESQMRSELEDQTRRISGLADDIRATDLSLSLHKAYIEQARRSRQKNTDQGLGDGEPMDLTYGQPPEDEYEDEDVMGNR